MTPKQLTDMLEDLEGLTNAVIEFRKATAFLEEPKPDDPEWPKLVDGKWTDKAGTVFDPVQHAVGRDTGTPSVTTAGIFRKRPKPARSE